MTVQNKRRGIKVAAPILVFIHITLAILLGRLFPLPLPAPAFLSWIGLGFTALGFVLGILAVIEFRRARVSSDPKKPAKALITSGVYRFTRNPVYLGFVLMLIGLPLSMRNYWGILLIQPLMTFMKDMVIRHEENYLMQEFKKQYVDYCSRVRRWL